MNFLLVAVGGFFGSMLRYYVSVMLNKHVIGTWIANFFGSILLAVIVNLQLAGNIAEWVWLLAGIGFCGAFTTFSTFGNETVELLLAKRYIAAFSYLLASIILTLLTVFFIIK